MQTQPVSVNFQKEGQPVAIYFSKDREGMTRPTLSLIGRHRAGHPICMTVYGSNISTFLSEKLVPPIFYFSFSQQFKIYTF